MRITIDLQAAQTEASYRRGIGRYAESLAWHMAMLAGDTAAVHLCLNGNYAAEHREVARRLHLSVQRPIHVTAYRYPALDQGVPGERGERSRLAEEMVASHWLSTQPDVLHVSNLAEGFAGGAAVPHRLPFIAGGLRSATLYDLIPLRFPDHYLRDPAFKAWYMRYVGTLRQCDLLLAISESTRQDAIDLLGMPPSAVRTIWGGVASQFSQAEVPATREAALRTRLGVPGRFVLYTGGDEYRKNLPGTIEAFARMDPGIRHDVQLVIVCAMEPARVRSHLEQAVRAGLSPQQVVMTGFVTDDDLVDLYRLCDTFVFPSWYEGFGLPVIEAMACGAPVIGGDNSSIREIIVRPDALFDAVDPHAIATMMARTLTDEAFAKSLRDTGLLRAREFTWERSARLALDAFAEALEPASSTTIPLPVPYPTRRRLALFSPLPPARTGIADHTALLLPHLGRHFDIEVFVEEVSKVDHDWILANVPVHAHTEFEKTFHRFDAVVYEIGNSEFHAHMLPILERFPGIVTLHDAYCGGLFAYLEFYAGLEGRYYGEMLDSHGPLARRAFAPVANVADPLFESVVGLPCTRRLIEQAIGVISHSPFNLDVARRFYPGGWRAPYRIIRQLVATRAPVSPAARLEIRQRLGFGPQDLIVATFGHIVWTKSGDVLLNAFLDSASAKDRRVKLVFVGELAADDFGRRLETLIARAADRGQVKVSGYLDETDFLDYLTITDVAVQLRKNSRGGTPKGVLDCMAAAVPVIVNAEASYLDYPDEVLTKIAAEYDSGVIATALDRLLMDAPLRKRVGAAGRRYVETNHHPSTLAREYAIAINEFIDRRDALTMASRHQRLSEVGAKTFADEDRETITREIAHQLEMAQVGRRRLLIDVSHLNAADLGTGIQRVVRSILSAMHLSGRPDFEPLAVTIDSDGGLRVARDLMASFGLAAKGDPVESESVAFRDDDVFFMLDSSWARWSEFAELHRKLRERGGIVVTAVYDLLPIRLPAYFVAGGAAWFENWLQAAITSSDAMVCISRSTADDLAAYIEAKSDKTHRVEGLRVGYWHLGSDIDAKEAAVGDPEIASAFDRPVLLMVGTIEPRKRHAEALAACEILWASGAEVNLVICGRRGWMVDELMTKLATHPEFGRRLHLFEGLSDSALRFAYEKALVLLFPSAGEGFGLPLIEAARHGLPIIANDLPVFREVGGDAVSYVCSDNAVEFADGIRQWLDEHRRGNTPDSRRMAHLTWQESGEQLLSVILDNNWYREIH